MFGRYEEHTKTNVFQMTNVLCQKTIHTIRVFHKQKLPMDFNGTEYRNVVYSIWDSTLFSQLTFFFKSTICQEICYSIKNTDTAISITWKQFQSDDYDSWNRMINSLIASLFFTKFFSLNYVLTWWNGVF